MILGLKNNLNCLICLELPVAMCVSIYVCVCACTHTNIHTMWVRKVDDWGYWPASLTIQ